MSALDRLNFIIATYGRLIAGIFNFRLWPPFLIYFLVMLLQILLLSNMFSPLLAGWFIPIVQWLSDPAVVHYPQHLVYLPSIFEKMNLVASFLLDSLLSASAVLMFVAYFDRQKIQFMTALKTARRYYVKLLLIWIIVFIPLLLLFWALPGLFQDFVAGAPRRKLALMVGMQALQTIVTALFVYVVPYLIIKGGTLGQAFSRNFTHFFKSFFTTVILVGIPQFAMLPLVYALQSTGSIVNKFNPSLVIWLTVGLAVALTLSNYFTLGAVVRFFRDTAED